MNIICIFHLRVRWRYYDTMIAREKISGGFQRWRQRLAGRGCGARRHPGLPSLYLSVDLLPASAKVGTRQSRPCPSHAPRPPALSIVNKTLRDQFHGRRGRGGFSWLLDQSLRDTDSSIVQTGVIGRRPPTVRSNLCRG